MCVFILSFYGSVNVICTQRAKRMSDYRWYLAHRVDAICISNGKIYSTHKIKCEWNRTSDFLQVKPTGSISLTWFVHSCWLLVATIHRKCELCKFRTDNLTHLFLISVFFCVITPLTPHSAYTESKRIYGT